MRQRLGDVGPELGVVLADPSREDECLHAGYHREVGTDVFAHPIGVDVEGEPGSRIAGGCPLAHFAHVAAAGESEEATATVEEFVEGGDVVAGFACEVEQDARVDIARARPHDETFERRHAHRRVNAAPVVNGGDRCAVADVTDDRVERVDGDAELRGCLLRHVSVTRAVESVTTDAVLRRDIRVDRVRGCGGGNRGVERGVEHRNLRNMGELSQHRADAEQVARIVQWCQRCE